MGWLISYDKLGEHETVDSRMRREMSWSQSDTANNNKHEIIASATVGSVWYAAVQIDWRDKPREVFAIVCLTTRGSRRLNDGFGYKDMDESVGPCECSCPARILDLLTPTASEYANTWRARCRERIAEQSKRKALRASLKPGVTIKLVAPLNYSGRMLDTFRVVPTPHRRRGLIGEYGGRLYRVPSRVIATATVINA